MAEEAGASLEVALRRELSCSVCLELFREPVALACGHSFCQACITHVWRSRERQRRLAPAPDRTSAGGRVPEVFPIPSPEADQSYSCPECRQVFPNKHFTKNFLAANLVEKLQGKRGSSGSQGDPAPRKCEKHKKALTVFCATDQRVLCSSCKLSKAHRSCGISLMQELTGEFVARKKELRARIQEEFARLIEFLIEEREILLLQLDQVEQAAIEEAEASQLDLGATVLELEDSIADIKSKLNRPVPLEELLDTISRPIPELGKHVAMKPPPRWDLFTGPLQLVAWKRMLDVINPGPENLYFNPKSAHPSLRFNGNYTLVESSQSETPDLEAVPDDPERFDCFPAVLGSARISSGRRYWEVDVGDALSWHLGVTCVHSPRQGYVKLSPAHGYWSICRLLGYWENGERRRPLAVDTELSKVGIYLDFEAGQLSFYNANSMALLCTFDIAFRGPMVPFFSPSRGTDSTLRLCHY